MAAERSAAETARVHEQVEQILDEGTGRRRTVIVRVGPTDTDAVRMADQFAETLPLRRMTTSPRELLPDTADIMASKTRSAADRRRLRGDVTSAAAQVAAAGIDAPTRGQLRRSGQRALRRLLRSDIASEAMSHAATRAPAPEVESVFWSSHSVLLHVPEAQLQTLVDEVEEIRDVHPNRRLDVPPVVRVSRLPQNVTDNKSSAWGLDAIGALATWGAHDARGRGVKVAVLDTGFDATHPDLDGKLAEFAEFDADGRRLLGAPPRDSHEHGTHVAGTVAGGRVGGSWIGVAPEAKILAGLVLDGDIGGTDAQVLAGIDWAIESGADVINMSLGGLTIGPEVPATYTEAMLTAVRAGIPVVTAIGNDGAQTSGSPGNDLFAFAVGATDHRDRPAGFSGGRTQVIVQSPFIRPEFLPLPYSKPDISAPGVAVRSCVPGGDYAAFNGTSMATPHVAGAVALLLSATGRLRSVPATERAFLVQDLLIGSVEELGEAGQDHRFGSGRLDILRAVGNAIEQGLG